MTGQLAVGQVAIEKVFKNYDEFCRQVGLIDSPDELARLGAPAPAHQNGMYETDKDQRDALNEFLEGHPNFHVATAIDGGDGYFVIENRSCLVNRIGFYLCNGDKDRYLILEMFEGDL